VRGLHGREGADDVVRTLSQRLHAVLRGGDLLARVDADEFVVVAAVRAEEDAVPVAAKVERALGTPIRIEHGVASVRPCLGAAIWPRDGDTHDALLARAALVGKLSGR
jgi:diguanylate cyclase (GGDEF)-like protein